MNLLSKRILITKEDTMKHSPLWQNKQRPPSRLARRWGRKNLGGLAVAVSLLLAGVSDANAGQIDIKVYPGTLCKETAREPESGRTKGRFVLNRTPTGNAGIATRDAGRNRPNQIRPPIQTHVSYDGSGRVFNRTTSSVTVVCPLIRDNSKKAWQEIQVSVADRHHTQDISCRAFSAKEDGLPVASTTDHSTGSNISSFASQILLLGKPAQERDYGTFYVRCNIPGKDSGYASGILTYRIIER